MRDVVASLALNAATLAKLTTFLFHSMAGVGLMRADHLVKVVLAHLAMSVSCITLQVDPQGQFLPTGA